MPYLTLETVTEQLEIINSLQEAFEKTRCDQEDAEYLAECLKDIAESKQQLEGWNTSMKNLKVTALHIPQITHNIFKMTFNSFLAVKASLDEALVASAPQKSSPAPRQ